MAEQFKLVMQLAMCFRFSYNRSWQMAPVWSSAMYSSRGIIQIIKLNYLEDQ